MLRFFPLFAQSLQLPAHILDQNLYKKGSLLVLKQPSCNVFHVANECWRLFEAWNQDQWDRQIEKCFFTVRVSQLSVKTIKMNFWAAVWIAGCKTSDSSCTAQKLQRLQIWVVKEKKATQQWGLLVIIDIVLNKVRVYHEKVYMDKVVSKFWFVRSFSSQHYSKCNTNTTSKKVSQIGTKECKTRSFISEVYLKFLGSSRHFNYDTAFAVIVSRLNKSVHDFNKILNGGLKTGFKIAKVRRLWKSFVKIHKHFLCDFLVDWWVRCFRNCNSPSRFSSSGKKFVKELSVLSGKSCADALQTNFIVNESNVKWLRSTFFDNIYYGYSRLVHPLLCMLEVFWKKLQHFQKISRVYCGV